MGAKQLVGNGKESLRGKVSAKTRSRSLCRWSKNAVEYIFIDCAKGKGKSQKGASANVNANAAVVTLCPTPLVLAMWGN